RGLGTPTPRVFILTHTADRTHRDHGFDRLWAEPQPRLCGGASARTGGHVRRWGVCDRSRGESRNHGALDSAHHRRACCVDYWTTDRDTGLALRRLVPGDGLV